MKKFLKVFIISLFFILLNVPAFAKTYIASNTSSSNITEGTILKVGEKIKFEGEIKESEENPILDIEFNYFKENDDDAYYEHYGLGSNYVTFIYDDEYPTVTIKSLDETGLNLSKTKTLSNGVEVDFLGWQVTYIKVDRYKNYMSSINLVPIYGLEHEIIKHPTNTDHSVEVTSTDHVTEYDFATFTKKDGFSARRGSGWYSPITSEINSDADGIDDISEDLGSWDISDKNKIVLKTSDYSVGSGLIYGYFNVDATSENQNIIIDQNMFESYGNNSLSIYIYNVSLAVDPDYSAYNYYKDQGYIPSSFKESLDKYKTTLPIYSTYISNPSYYDGDELVKSNTTDNIYYESEYKIDLSNLKEGLYKIYIEGVNQYNESLNLDLTNCDTILTFNNIDIFSLSDFAWLNNDKSSNKLDSKFIEDNKYYLVKVIYDDDYTLTSKTFIPSKSSNIIENIVDQIEEKITTPKAGDNIIVYILFGILGLIFLIVIRKRRA